jgi:CheY-like chemotaxis protein
LKDELARTAARLAEKENLENQFEKRRLEIIEVTAQFASAQRDIRNLSADLAEARLQAKLNARKAGTPASSAQSRPQAAPAVAEPSPGSGADPCNDAAGNEAVLAIRRCFQNISREPSKPGLLDELQTRAQSLADTGRDEGHPLLHRICTAFVALLADMRQLSQPISQGTLRTMNQTTELIASLLMDPSIEHKVSLDKARAYVVDDDQATCTTVTNALETVGLKTDHALYSSEAVAQLAGNQYDLIILDIHLPDLDGFELCAHIRNMALHAETPVFFISGNTSLENRVKSSLRGGNEFIAKPFSIQELALKSLKAVIKTQLHDR